MKWLRLFILITIFTMVLSGCVLSQEGGQLPAPVDQENPVDPVPDSKNPEGEQNPGTEGDGEPGSDKGTTPGPSESPWMDQLPELGKEMAMISLAIEPRLHAPIQTTIAPSAQQFVIQFAEAMKRESVETALEQQLQGPEGTVLRFDWASDQLLELEIQVPDPASEEADDFGQRSYVLNINQAQTQLGQILQEVPVFKSVLIAPKQLWRISPDGLQQEQLTKLEEPYDFYYSSVTPDYVVVKRYQEYCECDATLPYLYGVYNIQDQELVSYPVDLLDNYTGIGQFYADPRGFFYAQPDDEVAVPNFEQAIPISIPGYVHGSAFSLDGERIIAAVAGSKEQTENLDLVIVHLKSGKQHRLEGVLKGQLEESMVSSALLPVQFLDDGAYVYVTMIDPSSEEPFFSQLRYQYEWATEHFSEWEAPLEKSQWTSFSFSSDGMYRLYANAGLFKNGVKVELPEDHFTYPVHWLGGTHSFVVHEYVPLSDDRHVTQLGLYDVDLNEKKMILEQLPLNTHVLGTSKDGQWIYVQTSHAF